MRKGKRIWRVRGLFCLFCLFCLMGCSRQQKVEKHAVTGQTVSAGYLDAKAVSLPYLGLLEQGVAFQPIAGTATQIELTTYQKAAALCDSAGFHFWAKGDWQDHLWRMELYQAGDGSLIWEQNDFALSFQPEALKTNELYVLRLIMTAAGTDFFYDLPFFYQEKTEYGRVIAELAASLAQRPDPEILMGEVAVQVEEATPDGRIKGRAKAMAAIRREKGLEYQDHFYTFTAGSGEFQLEERLLNRKRGAYDKIRKSVILSAGGEWHEADGRFVQIEDGEVYAGDGQMVYTLYRRDAINDDYLTDEFSPLRFRHIGWRDQKYYFLGYGTFAEDLPDLGNRRGIAFFEWNGRTLQTIAFAEVPDAELSAYAGEQIFTDEKRAEVYWLRPGGYFVLNLPERAFSKRQVLAHSYFDRQRALIYWQAQEDKKNQAVLWSNLRQQAIYSIYQEDRNLKILGTGQKGIYVGEYQVADTLEYLDRRLVYPLRRVTLYSPEGKELAGLQAQAGSYFGLPEFTGDDRGLLPVLRKRTVSAARPGEVRVDYVRTGEQSFDFSGLLQKSESGAVKPTVETGTLPGQAADFYGWPLRLVAGTAQKAEVGRGRIAVLDWRDALADSGYFVQAEADRIFAEDLRDALQQAPPASTYQIYYKNGKKNPKKLYDSAWLTDSAWINGFSTVSQLPELPRGCEVTALSMLLKFYDPEMPDRFALADELLEYGRSFQPAAAYQVDMKEAFAGSIHDAEAAGLGVYIEPISVLARRYLGSRAQNITGASLTQILTFVSHGQPVQIISSNMAAVPDALKISWQTENGYMEITYREHSVVVVGFDGAFIYYADPLTGRVGKSPKASFEAGYEAFGRQALVITE